MKLRLLRGLRGLTLQIETFAFVGERANPKDRAYLAKVSDLRAKLDSRKMRTFVLPNQLEVLLIQDPAAQNSAAAMDVGVGSLMDPRHHKGLAHYVEHMLFLGTQKYPRVGE